MGDCTPPRGGVLWGFMDRITVLVALVFLSLSCTPKRVVEASSTIEDLPNEPSTEAGPSAPESSPETAAADAQPAPAPAPAPSLIKVDVTEGFSVLLPKDPQVQRRAVPLKKSGTVQTVTLSASLDGALYSVTRADYPAAVVAKKGATKMLGEVKAGLAAQLKGTVGEEKDSPLVGHPGQSFSIASATNIVQARSAVVGNQVFSLIVVHTGPPPALTATFLNSIELVAAPPAPAPASAPAPAPAAPAPAAPAPAPAK